MNDLIALRFIGNVTSCDILTEDCSTTPFAQNLLNTNRLQIQQNRQGVVIRMRDDVGNNLDHEGREEFMLVQIRDFMGNTLMVNETENDSWLEARDFKGNVASVWESETERKVHVRDFTFNFVENFMVGLERAEFSCFYCQCKD